MKLLMVYKPEALRPIYQRNNKKEGAMVVGIVAFFLVEHADRHTNRVHQHHVSTDN